MATAKELADYHFQQVSMGLGSPEARAQEIQQACDGLEPVAQRAFIHAYNAALTGEEPQPTPTSAAGMSGHALANRHWDELHAISGGAPEDVQQLIARHKADDASAVAGLSAAQQLEYLQAKSAAMQARMEQDKVNQGVMPIPLGDVFLKGRVMGLGHWEAMLPVLFAGGDHKAIEAKNNTARDEALTPLGLSEKSEFLGGYQAGAKLANDRRQAKPASVATPVVTAAAPAAVKSVVEAVPFWATNSGKVEFIAGDYGTGRGSIQNGNAIQLPVRNGAIAFRHIKSVTIANEEAVKKLGGTLGWGAVGAVALGPVGLLAGLLGGGNKTDVTFIVVFDNDTKLLARAETSVFTKLQAAAFS
jgi:hypothetical protein